MAAYRAFSASTRAFSASPRAFSSKRSALTFEGVIEKVSAEIKEAEVQSVQSIDEQVQTMRTSFSAMKSDVAKSIAEHSVDHYKRLHEITQNYIKSQVELDNDLTKLQVEFEAAKLQAVKYSVGGTLAFVAVATVMFKGC